MFANITDDQSATYREGEGPPSKKARKANKPTENTHLVRKGKHKAKTEVVSDSRLASYGIKKKK